MNYRRRNGKQGNSGSTDVTADINKNQSHKPQLGLSCGDELSSARAITSANVRGPCRRIHTSLLPFLSCRRRRDHIEPMSLTTTKSTTDNTIETATEGIYCSADFKRFIIFSTHSVGPLYCLIGFVIIDSRRPVGGGFDLSYCLFSLTLLLLLGWHGAISHVLQVRTYNLFLLVGRVTGVVSFRHPHEQNAIPSASAPHLHNGSVRTAERFPINEAPNFLVPANIRSGEPTSAPLLCERGHRASERRRMSPNEIDFEICNVSHTDATGGHVHSRLAKVQCTQNELANGRNRME
ncbi:hypothetical protein CBL_01420 [Carabus blaptoides fortunei]